LTASEARTATILNAQRARAFTLRVRIEDRRGAKIKYSGTSAARRSVNNHRAQCGPLQAGGREGDGQDSGPIELEERCLRGSFGDAELKCGERRAEDANLLADVPG
jgi:hypothetical protein